MQLGVHIGYWGLGLSSDDQREIVLEAERLGYDCVWTAEAYGSDAATILGWLAGLTSTIKLGSAIFQPRAGTASASIAPTVHVAVTDDLAAARDQMRPFLALYVGGMGSREKNFYNALVRRHGFEDEAREVQDLCLDGKRKEAMARLSDELIDTVSLVGPPEHVSERLAIYRDAGVGTLGVILLAFDKVRRLEQLRLIAELTA